MIRRILKINIKDLKDANWNLDLPYEKAMMEEKAVGIGNSQVIHWINELHGTTEEELEEQYSELKGKRSKASSLEERNEITKQMRDMEFIEELVQIQFNVNKQMVTDFHKTIEGFVINGIEYVWFANKGKSFTTYIKKDLADDFRAKLDNGRDLTKQFISAKLNAYLSLALSSSRRVPQPKGKIIIVHDVETKFMDTYLSVTTEGVEKVTEEVTLDASDGFGLIHPRLMQEWSDAMNYGGKMSSGLTIRNAFLKGLVVPFPYDEFFAEHGITEIKDAWGNVHTVDNIDMILTTSMLKLWNCYSSMEEYEANCRKNGYEYRVCKESHEVEHSRTNYQMTTDLEMTDEQIRRFIQPSVDYIANICGKDWLHTCLYLNGESLTECSTSVSGLEQALMIAPEMIEDKMIIGTVRHLVDKRKQDLCLGRINISSSYQIICIDPYLLCEHICNMPLQGLLKRDEIWSKHHVDKGDNEVLLFRSPMISKENIKRSKVVTSPKMEQYYRYMTELVVLNAWDLTCATLAGADCDGDTVLCIDDEVLLEVQEPTLPVFCEGVKGNKSCCDTIEPLIQANILALNDKKYNIGSCINKITSQFSVRSQFDKDSREYKELNDRILMGLMISQGYIDFVKNGTVVMEMPKHWYSLKECDKLNVSDEEKEFQKRICADSTKKPYFLLYNSENKKAKDTYKNTIDFIHTRSLINFGMTGEEFLHMNKEDMTDVMKNFYDTQMERMPIFVNDNSTQHRICLECEKAIKELAYSDKSKDFRHLLKCTNVQENKEYKALVKEAKKLHKDLKGDINNIFKNSFLSDKDIKKVKYDMKNELQENFVNEVLIMCNGDVELALNVLIDTVYSGEVSPTVIWQTTWCKDIMVDNLLKAKGYMMNIPVRDENGEYEYKGKRFTVKQIKIEK